VTGYFKRRLLYSLFVIWGAVTVVFVVVRIVPGDPALLIAGPQASTGEVAAVRHRLGLDQSLSSQYLQFVGQAVRLDFGESLRFGGPSLDVVASRLPATGELAAVALLLALLVSFPLGVIAAVRYGTRIDSIASVLSLIGQSIPSFWLGIMLILVFAGELRVLPSGGAESWRHFLLPAFTLSLPFTGILTRLVRSGLLEVLGEDYVRTAKGKGLTATTVLTRHAIRNMLIPLVTVVGLQLGYLLGGTVVVEMVFAWPGVGRVLVDAISYRDYPVVQAAVLLGTTAFVGINFLIDLSYAYLDPRIRLS
jgi:peptide/nickel transport system permease protein